MRVKFLSIAFLISLLLTSASSGAGVREYTLNNGLKVLMTEDHKSPIAVFQVWYRVGSMDEPSGKSGMSHLLEHMMFKGTPEHPSKELSQTVQRYGGSDNAFTTKDYTAYYQILPSDRLDLSLEFESDRMTNLTLDEKETMSERSVVMEERRMRYEDDPQNLLYEEVIAAAFKVHPYRRPVIGWMSDLANITPGDLREYYKTHYSPDEAVIVAAGDIDPDSLIKKIERKFGGIKPGPGWKPLPHREPVQKGPKRVYLKKEAELPYIFSVYHVPSFPDRDSYALDVLAKVLSGGKSARLYKSLVYEKKLALYAFADYSGLHRDPFLFFLGGAASPGKDIGDLEGALYAEVDRLKAEPPTDFELDKAKNQIEAEFVMGQDSVFFQAELLGMFEMAGGWRLKDGYIAGIRSVSAEDVSAAAAKYLTEDNRTTGVLVPLDNKEDK